MPPCGFAEALRRRREFIPEAVEIYALPPLYQPFHVGAAEPKMPKQGVLEDFIPWANAGHRRVDEDEARHTWAVQRRESVSNHVADIVRYEGRTVDLEDVQNL